MAAWMATPEVDFAIMLYASCFVLIAAQQGKRGRNETGMTLKLVRPF